MKKSFLLLYFLTSLTSAQWIQQTSNTSVTLNAVYFISLDTGIVVGNSGTILKTTNGGESWIPKTSSTSNNIKDIVFTNKNTGFITCPGKILRTNDCGESWSVIFTGPENFNSITFADSITGYVAGDYVSGTQNYLKIFKTTDGGTSWNTVYNESGLFLELRDISFADISNGMAVGYNGVIYKTNNAGISWNKVVHSPGSPGFFSVFYLDSENALLGSLDLIRTTDGGSSWFTVYSPSMGTIQGISFPDMVSGVAVGSQGVNSNALIIKTSNGGMSWTEDPVFFPGLYDVCFTDLNHGTAVGRNGTILRTINYSLPVQFTSFTAEVISGGVELGWRTASEINNRGFEVQRKIPEGEWVIISFKTGAGTTSEISNYSFLDKPEITGEYYYRLKQIDFNGSFEYSDEVSVYFNYAEKFSLKQNYPNPFNPITRITFSIPEDTKVTLVVYDILGNEIKNLVNDNFSAGSYDLDFNAGSLASGIYFYKLSAGKYSETKKLQFLK
jgi:photosystem II stability/assembly factor-like uncharacterized protein